MRRRPYIKESVTDEQLSKAGFDVREGFREGLEYAVRYNKEPKSDLYISLDEESKLGLGYREVIFDSPFSKHDIKDDIKDLEELDYIEWK